MQRLEDKEAVIASLEDKHRHARESLEHYRASQKTQREQEQREHADQVQHFRAQLREQAQTLAVKQHELTQLNRDNARLVTELSDLQRVYRDLNASATQTTVARDALAAAKNKLERQLARKDEAHADLVAAHDILQQQVDDARQAVAEWETRCLKLRTELKVQGGLFETLRQQIRPLGDPPPAR